MNKLETDICLRNYNTLNIKSHVSYFIQVNNIKDLSFAREIIDSLGCDYYLLGSGSNIVIANEFLKKLVIKINFKGCVELKSQNNSLIKVAAGENWDKFVDWAVEHGIYCFSYLAGIPGTVGAAPVQNIGAYGSEIANFIEWVEVYDMESGKTSKILSDDCEYGYRSSIFQRYKNLVITGLVLRTTSSPKAISKIDSRHYSEEIINQMNAKNLTLHEKNIHTAVRLVRESKLPDYINRPNVGSFFKNPVVSREFIYKTPWTFSKLKSFNVKDGIKLSAAELIESCGMKGKYFEGVGMSSKHSLVLENNSNAGFEKINFVVEMVQKAVQQKYGINLEVEPTIWS